MPTERERAYQRRYRAEHRAELNAYKAEWARDQRRLNTESAEKMRQAARRNLETKRERALQAKGYAMAAASYTLHALSCPYPERGCDCRVLVVR
jgi:hypothetical protein